MTSQPAILLLSTAGATAAALLLFWPGRGFVSRWIRLLRIGRRVAIEDALKHLHDCEYVGRPATLQSLAGTLEIPANRTAALAAQLEARKLLQSAGGGLELTPEGRRYALRVIRTHRLWEHYLADHTGHREADWHREADRQEHSLTAAEVDRLASQLGNPRFDPHGDPIPTAEGEIPPRRGQPLVNLAAGVPATIVHVEDEPEALYAQLLAQGLRPGMRLRVLDATATRIRFEADGEEQVLAPVVAANVWVAPLPTETELAGPGEPLSGLAAGETGTVVGISRACRGLQRRRLLDLGIRPGAEVRAEFTAPSGDPTGYLVCGAIIALREEQARQIRIARAETGTDG